MEQNNPTEHESLLCIRCLNYFNRPADPKSNEVACYVLGALVRRNQKWKCFLEAPQMLRGAEFSAGNWHVTAITLTSPLLTLNP
jgi:hypothetical protein